MRNFRVTLDYQTEAGDASSARYDVEAEDENEAQASAVRLLETDKRRRPGKIVAGTVESLK